MGPVANSACNFQLSRRANRLVVDRVMIAMSTNWSAKRRMPMQGRTRAVSCSFLSRHDWSTTHLDKGIFQPVYEDIDGIDNGWSRFVPELAYYLQIRIDLLVTNGRMSKLLIDKENEHGSRSPSKETHKDIQYQRAKSPPNGRLKSFRSAGSPSSSGLDSERQSFRFGSLR